MLESSLLSLAVHRPQDVQQLTPDRSIRLELHQSKLSREIRNGSSGGKAYEISFEFRIHPPVDSHVRMPRASVMRLPPAHGIARILDGVPAGVAVELPLPLLFAEEYVFARSRNQDEEAAVSQVLHVCSPSLLSPSTGPLPDIEVVFLDHLSVEVSRVLPLRHRARHEIDVAIGHVIDQLLNEAHDRSRFATIRHTASSLLRHHKVEE